MVTFGMELNNISMTLKDNDNWSDAVGNFI